MFFLLAFGLVSEGKVISVTHPSCPGATDGSITYYTRRTVDITLNLIGGSCDVITTDSGLGAGPHTVRTNKYWDLPVVGCSDTDADVDYTVTLFDTDNTSPTAICKNVTVQLNGAGTASILADDVNNGSSDNCGIASLLVSPSNFDCGDIGTNIVSLTVTDNSGNTNACSAIVTIEENVSPVALCQNMTYSLDAYGQVEVDAIDIDNGSSDNCTADEDLIFGLSENIFTCQDTGVNDVVLYVEDEAGNIGQCLAEITIVDDLAPVVGCFPLTVELDENGMYSLSETDIEAMNDDDTEDNCTSYGQLDVTVDDDSYDCSDLGDVPVILSVADLSGNVGTCSTTVTVEDNIVPVAMCQDITIQLDYNGNATMTAADIDGGSSDNCAITLSIDKEYLDWDCADVGDNKVVLTVTDEAGNTATCEATVTVEDNVVPDATCQHITLYLDVNGYASIAASDVDGGSWDACGIDTMWLDRYEFGCEDVCQNECSIPDLKTKSATAGADIPKCPMVTLTVQDVNGNTNSCLAMVRVLDWIWPEVITQDITVDLDETGWATITVDDINDGSNDACGIKNMWLSNYTFNCDDVCTNLNGENLDECPTVILYVEDNNCHTSSAMATVTVRDASAPDVMCQNVTIYLDDNGYASITAYTDVLVSNEIDNGSTDNCGIESYEILESMDFYCDDIYEMAGDHTVTLKVTDVHNNTSSCSATVRVLDEVVPMVQCQDVTVYLDENGTATITADKMYTYGYPNKSAEGVLIPNNNILASWWDNCPEHVTTSISKYVFTCDDICKVVFDENRPIPAPAPCNPVTLTVTDGAGNTATCIPSLTVIDNLPPHVITQNITVCLDDNGSYTVTTAEIDNGSWDNCEIQNMMLDRTDFACVDTGMHTVTLTVWDVNGNSASNTASVTVKDCTPPVVNCRPLTVELYENGEYVLNPRDILYMSVGPDDNLTWDNCTDYDDMVIDIFPRSFECIHVHETQTVVVSATDVSGNTGTCATTIVVEDNTAPVMFCKDITVYLDEDGEARIFPGDLNDGERASIPEWARTYNGLEGGCYDACGIDSAWTSQVLFNCGDVGDVAVTLSMIDPSDNLSSCVATVTVIDTFPPHIDLVDDITIQVEPGVCETAITYPEAVVTGNCGFDLAQTAGLGADGMFPLGTTTETWVATAPGGLTAEISFTVTVETTNALPEIDAIDDVEVDEDTPSVTVPISGVSYGIDCVAQTVAVTAVGNNAGLITDVVANHVANAATGSIVLTIAPEMSGSADISVVVTDGEGASVVETFTITVNAVNDAPFVVAPVPAQTVNASYELSVTISSVLGDLFDDIDDDELTVGVALEGGAPLPAWVTIVGDVATIKPMIADTGCYTMVVTATDAAGASASSNFELCVEGYPVSIGELDAGIFEVKMYPNPTQGAVNLELNTNGIHEVDVAVMDITGRQVLRKQYSASENITFDMTGKVSGMYFVQLNVDGKQMVKKLIVDRK